MTMCLSKITLTHYNCIWHINMYTGVTMYKMSKEQRNKSFESTGISLIYPENGWSLSTYS